MKKGTVLDRRIQWEWGEGLERKWRARPMETPLMSDELDKARAALKNAHPMFHIEALEAFVRAIIADHEEQQLHEAMHGPIADPLPKDGKAPVPRGYEEMVKALRERGDMLSLATAHEICEAHRRIAELERERDEAIINLRNAREGQAMARGLTPGAEAEAARLRKAIEDAMKRVNDCADRVANRDDMPYGSRDYNDLRTAIRLAFVGLTTSLQPKSTPDDVK